MQWLRLYHDTITDPKWRVVANESGQPEANVLAVWMHMLVNASTSAERGTLEGWNDRVVAASLGIRTEAVAAIFDAMQGLVLDGDRLTGWDKRQRASDDINERVKRHRTKAKDTPPGGGSTNGTGKHRNVTNGECNVTPTLHNVTVTENPLDLSYLPAATPTLEKNRGGGDARPHEVCERVAELTGLPENVGTVAAWLAEGFDPERDIYPAVQGVTAPATGVGCMNYFTKAIRRHHAARITPPQESTNVHPIRNAGSGKSSSGRGTLISRIALGLA